MLASVPLSTLNLIASYLDLPEAGHLAALCQHLAASIPLLYLWKDAIASDEKFCSDMLEEGGEAAAYETCKDFFRAMAKLRRQLIDCGGRQALRGFPPLVGCMSHQYLGLERYRHGPREAARELLKRSKRLDETYYASRAFTFAEHKRLFAELSKLPQKYPMHLVSIFFEKYCQAAGCVVEGDDTAFTAVKNTAPPRTLQETADDCLRHLRNTIRSSHPIIDSMQGSREIVDAILATMDEAGIRVPFDSFYMVKNSFISETLKTGKGIPITIAAIIIGLANAFGVADLHPVNFPGCFLLRGGSPLDSDAYFVDPSCLSTMSREQLVEKYSQVILQSGRTFNELTAPCPPIEVLARCCRNVFNIFRQSRSENGILLLAALFLHLPPLLHCSRQFFLQLTSYLIELCEEKSCLSYVKEILHDTFDSVYDESPLSARVEERIGETIASQDEIPENMIRKRTCGIDRQPFFIGSVCRHVRYNYTCVVVGWDLTCKQSEAWIQRMGVDLLNRGRTQPFHHVLANDGSSRYAAKESLQRIYHSNSLGGMEFSNIENSHPVVGHDQVGRYFTHFDAGSGRYDAVRRLKEMYPDDYPL